LFAKKQAGGVINNQCELTNSNPLLEARAGSEYENIVTTANALVK
jgi:hypothetical protein